MSLIDELEHIRRKYEKAETEAEKRFYSLAAELVIKRLEEVYKNG